VLLTCRILVHCITTFDGEKYMETITRLEKKTTNIYRNQYALKSIKKKNLQNIKHQNIKS